MRTNSANQLYDEDGALTPSATTFNSDDILLDRNGDPVLNEDGTPRKGDELRVKYFLGAQPEPRYREMFTETAVSHLFWAMGIPVDRVYMPASVRCFGCGPDPDQQGRLEPGSTAREFRFASIERRYAGKQINVDRRRGWMGLGGEYGHGFAFAELEGLAESGQLNRTDLEVLIAALNVVGYNSPSSYQNELVCRPREWSKETGICRQPVAYVQDVGGTLGGEKARGLPGIPVSTMKNHPRGDWPTFSQERVFRDATRCTLSYEIAGVDHLTEAGRQAMVRRIRGRIGLDEILLIVGKANLHRMDARIMAAASVQSGLPVGPALDRYVQRMWAVTINNRLLEILNARCRD